MYYDMTGSQGCLGTNLGQGILHDFWAVVDGEDDIGDTGLSEGLYLVLDHGFVGKLDQGLGHCQGLATQCRVSGCDVQSS